MSGMRASSSSNITRSSRRARLAPRQKCVPKPPKATWWFGLRVDVEAVGIAEHALVAVRRRVEQQQAVALADLLAAQLDVARDGAVHVLDRASPSAASPRRRVGCCADRRSASRFCVRVLDQREQAARHHVARRLVAADQDQQALLEDLLLATARSPSISACTRMLIRSSRGCFAAIGDHGLRDSAMYSSADRRLLLAALAVVLDLRPTSPPPSSSSDQRSSLSRSSGSHAEHVADHDHRDPARDVVHEVALAALGRPRRSARGRSRGSSARAPATRRGVKPRFTRLRRRLCSGSSRLIIDGIYESRSGRELLPEQKISGVFAIDMMSS